MNKHEAHLVEFVSRWLANPDSSHLLSKAELYRVCSGLQHKAIARMLERNFPVNPRLPYYIAPRPLCWPTKIREFVDDMISQNKTVTVEDITAQLRCHRSNVIYVKRRYFADNALLDVGVSGVVKSKLKKTHNVEEPCGMELEAEPEPEPEPPHLPPAEYITSPGPDGEGDEFSPPSPPIDVISLFLNLDND